jgi:hypothetical protein
MATTSITLWPALGTMPDKHCDDHDRVAIA